VGDAGYSYYRADLARAHHMGFGFHADACARGIIRLVAQGSRAEGLVVELGCGSGHLTRHLLQDGHRVIAIDASPAMPELARSHAPDAEDFRVVVLPDHPIPEVDAIVSGGHVLSYLPDEAAIQRALRAICGALRPGGVLALDICDLTWGDGRRNAHRARTSTMSGYSCRFFVPASNRFVREMTTFVRGDDGLWHRAG
jgi:SAM-dependent methyltransferase